MLEVASIRQNALKTFVNTRPTDLPLLITSTPVFLTCPPLLLPYLELGTTLIEGITALARWTADLASLRVTRLLAKRPPLSPRATTKSSFPFGLSLMWTAFRRSLTTFPASVSLTFALVLAPNEPRRLARQKWLNTPLTLVVVTFELALPTLTTVQLLLRDIPTETALLVPARPNVPDNRPPTIPRTRPRLHYILTLLPRPPNPKPTRPSSVHLRKSRQPLHRKPIRPRWSIPTPTRFRLRPWKLSNLATSLCNRRSPPQTFNIPPHTPGANARIRNNALIRLMTSANGAWNLRETPAKKWSPDRPSVLRLLTRPPLHPNDLWSPTSEPQPRTRHYNRSTAMTAQTRQVYYALH